MIFLEEEKGKLYVGNTQGILGRKYREKSLFLHKKTTNLDSN